MLRQIQYISNNLNLHAQRTTHFVGKGLKTLHKDIKYCFKTGYNKILLKIKYQSYFSGIINLSPSLIFVSFN